MIDTLGSAHREQHEMISYFSWDAPATKISPYLACQGEFCRSRATHTLAAHSTCSWGGSAGSEV